jgi:molybdenum cofactor biosynthesis enzyme
MLKVACPLAIVPVPSVVVPSLNVTVPVAADGETVAVKVTDEPKPDGLEDEATVTVVFALLTVWVKTEDVAGLSFPSPP